MLYFLLFVSVASELYEGKKRFFNAKYATAVSVRSSVYTVWRLWMISAYMREVMALRH